MLFGNGDTNSISNDLNLFIKVVFFKLSISSAFTEVIKQKLSEMGF